MSASSRVTAPHLRSELGDLSFHGFFRRFTGAKEAYPFWPCIWSGGDARRGAASQPSKSPLASRTTMPMSRGACHRNNAFPSIWGISLDHDMRCILSSRATRADDQGELPRSEYELEQAYAGQSAFAGKRNTIPEPADNGAPKSHLTRVQKSIVALCITAVLSALR
jgi:hypothetical protein